MIKELKTLIAVAREGTFAAAGDRIGLTQAAVSAQMQRLEAQLGVELFDRKGRSAQLNRMGQQVLLQGQELVRLYGSLGNSATGSAPNVLVTIGAIASVQRSFLPDALALFHRQFPQCRTRVIPGLSMDLVNQVDAGEVDLAAIIRPPFSLHSDLRWTTLMREPYRLIVPADLQGEDWAELISSQPFIRYDRSSFGGRQVDRFLRQTHVSLREVCELDELDAIVKLVANGVGVALVPETATIQAWPAGVRAVNLGPHTFHRDIGLVHRARRSLTEPVNVLAQLLTAQVQDTQ
ncbi:MULTISPECIES: LysR family transcriptional regulator [Pseudomonas syringae group]|uniref:Transcriptional regulator, LysR family n=2 Tax=Pseudomonas syringae group genomosp. 3 TaxID=251701 RepID=Q880D9_PSESM|nr:MULTISPECIES: LysR family transcriptional regulator [Pseudomonas syringae group]KPC12559.1 Transcriptional regulator [Pseudomonas amygdali pv. lachrymans]AAO56711.1 transcriptional regulator, LysR family [Pseudomonas syringae pv. tomato str. DC3000]EGH99366.1 transcriptional regulator, LysR family protein [Pseudomonas amygdali pv. lachrymans str. M302278]KKI23936.1 LysR family transcriptional regulator [Pseudomonas syringae pv. persicae]KPB95996.1 Transcriptional regulator [Pseudomonas syri